MSMIINAVHYHSDIRDHADRDDEDRDDDKHDDGDEDHDYKQDYDGDDHKLSKRDPNEKLLF